MAGQPNRWKALAGLCTAAGLVWLAFADLGVALPTISTQLTVGLTDLQWTNNAFSLTCGALVLAAGRFSDLYGSRRILLIGCAVFGGFSLLTAFLSGLAGLVVGRALMGVKRAHRFERGRGCPAADPGRPASVHSGHIPLGVRVRGRRGAAHHRCGGRTRRHRVALALAPLIVNGFAPRP